MNAVSAMDLSMRSMATRPKTGAAGLAQSVMIEPRKKKKKRPGYDTMNFSLVMPDSTHDLSMSHHMVTT